MTINRGKSIPPATICERIEATDMSECEVKKINDYVYYIPASETPLSGDVCVIYGENATYVYDVGSTAEMLDFLHSLEKPFDIVCSHFHADHVWWLTDHKPGEPGVRDDDKLSLNYKKPEYRNLYVSSETFRHTKAGTLINERITVYDRIKTIMENESTESKGVLKLDIIPCPTSHCKGSLLLMVNDDIIFAGDSVYCRDYTDENGEHHAAYNTQLLKSQIELLESLPAEKIFMSHNKKPLRPKKVALRELSAVYSHREPGKSEIIM